MTVEELLQQNIPNRLTQIESLYGREKVALEKIEKYVDELKELKGSLIKRMSLIEEFIKNIAELSYKGGFYEPDKSGEQKIIASLKKDIEEKNKRISEFENTFKQLMGKK